MAGTPWRMAALMMAAASAVAAVPPAGEIDTGRVARVEVVVDGREAVPEIRELVSVKAGDAFSLRRIDLSLHQLYRSGLFSDIRVERREGEPLVLVYVLSRKLLVGRMTFPEKLKLPWRKVRAGLTALRPGMPYSEERLQRCVEEVRDILQGEGYFLSRVAAVPSADSAAASVDVRFNIQPGRRYIISSLDLQADISLAVREFKRRLASRPGRVFVPSLLDKDIDLLSAAMHAAGYQRARVSAAEPVFEQEGGTVSLRLIVQAGEKIDIVINGARVPLDLVRPIWEERVFEEWGLLEGEARILSFLRKTGHIFALVTSRVEKTENLIRVVYDAEPGERYSIRGLRFEGLTHFTPDEIKAALEIQTPFPGASVLEGDRVLSLPEEITDFYRTQGFPRPRVDLEFERSGRDLSLVYVVEEGPKQTLNRVVAEGVSFFDPDRVLEEVGSKPGGPFFQPNIQMDVERLEAFYLNQGLRGTKISAEVLALTGDLFDIVFHIQEGRRVRVEKITVTGQKATRRATILREVRLKEGELAYQQPILETKRNLERLGVFTEVRVEEVPLSADRINLIINLREGERNYIGFGLGVENKNIPFELTLWENVISPRGTAEYIRSNVFGDASQFSLVGQFSLREKRGAVSFEQPYFFGRPLQNTLSAWLEREDRNSYGFDRRGASLSGLVPLYRELLLLTSLTWTSTTLYYLDIAENEVDRQFFPFSKTSLSTSLLWDRRDDTLNPSRGAFLSASLEWAYPLFGIESDFLKLFIKYQDNFPLFSRLRVSATGRLGLGQGRMPIHERFFAGGSNSFRGRDYDELGPLDPVSGRPVGGKVLLLFNLEVSFPIIATLRDLTLTFFYDKGNVFAKRKDFDLGELQDAVGFGLRYRTPLGPIRFDVGLNPRAPVGQKKIFPFITIGHVF